MCQIKYSFIFNGFILFILVLVSSSCKTDKDTVSQNVVTRVLEKDTIPKFEIQKMLVDGDDPLHGSYAVVMPETDEIKGVLVLLSANYMVPSQIIEQTRLHDLGSQEDFMTIVFPSFMFQVADDYFIEKFHAVVNHALNTFDIKKDEFISGGLSTGGTLALRYAELCLASPENYPIIPKAVFVIDTPVDLFYQWEINKEIILHSDVKEAYEKAVNLSRNYDRIWEGDSRDQDDFFIELTPFCMDPSKCDNVKYLKDLPIRAYHFENLNNEQSFDKKSLVQNNSIAASAFITRLKELGNTKAELIYLPEIEKVAALKEKGHTWSIIDENECITWIKSVLNN